MKQSGVYFAVAGEHVKIGWSANVYQRMREMAVYNPHEVYLAVILEGPRTTERRLHAFFAESWERGEWYRVEGPLEAFLQAVDPDRKIVPFSEALDEITGHLYGFTR